MGVGRSCAPAMWGIADRKRERKDGEMGKEAERITVGYSDGSSREVRRGMCLEFRGDRGGMEEMAADMVGLGGMDLIVTAAALFELVDRMGLSDAMLAYTEGYQNGE